jgi:hypothetical protein
MKRLAWLVLFVLFVGCQRTPRTPEEVFKMFSLSAGMGQPVGMERYGEKEYAKELQDRFDLLALLSAFWPKDVMVVKSETVDGVATLNVQGTNSIGKTVQGTFQLRQRDGVWKVFAGDWQNLSGQESAEEASPTSTEQSEASDPGSDSEG